MYSVYKTNSIFKIDFLQNKISVSCVKKRGVQLKETLFQLFTISLYPSMARVTGKHE